MAIKQQQYKDFSWDLHADAGHKPIVVQMELTSRCPLHCEHCYIDCYNNKDCASKELTTIQIKGIMDKCKLGGAIWFCFTGGDPMMRKDFGELYLYAKKLGFITSVFSPIVAMSEKIFETFILMPPFNIETTLNAATPGKYREIARTNRFNKHIQNIKKLLKNGIPVRVKTQVTKQNISQIDEIKKLVESFDLDFRPSTMLNARLNNDTHPCDLRLDPKKTVLVNKKYGFFDEEALRPGEKMNLDELIKKPESKKLLSCAAGGHAFWITSFGEMILCGSLRRFKYNLLNEKNTVKDGFYSLNKKVHGLIFKTKSKCGICEYRMICKWCPGRAILEKGYLEEPIDYFCKLTEETVIAYRS